MASTNEDLNAISTVNDDGSPSYISEEEWFDFVPPKDPVVIRGAGNVTV